MCPSVGATPNQSLASTNWGDELDLIVTYNYGPRTNILFGYSRFWTGSKIIPPGGAVDADFFYTQWELNFLGMSTMMLRCLEPASRDSLRVQSFATR